MPTPQRLPLIDGDDGQWGDILNQFITKEHYDTGADNAANGGHKTVTIRAGTATAGTAPLKLTSGTLLTVPEAGAFEFNTDTLYFTKTTGPTRNTIACYDDSSGATGDIYYRASGGVFTRLGIGSTGDVLKVTAGLPSWAAPSGGAPGGSTKQLQYNNGGSFAGTTGFEYQASVDPTVKITAQGDYSALLVKGYPSQSNPLLRLESDSGTDYMDVVPGGFQLNGDVVLVREAADTLSMNGKFHIIAGSTETIPKISINGSTSGATSIQSAAVAGTTTVTLPSSNGTLENVAKATRVDTNGSYSLTTANVICLADASSGTITYTLPTASGNQGHRFYIKKTDSSANNVVINRAGADTIDGATSQTVSAQYQCLMLVSDGASSWFII